MSTKYKSPLIKSRSTSFTSTPVNTQQNIQSSSQQENANSTGSSFSEYLVQDTSPICNFSEPRFSNSRARGTPYQWRSPYGFNNSWSSYQNNSGSYMSEQASHYHEYRPKFRNPNYNNNSNLSSKNNDERYFHPSMLEDPWAPLLYITK